MKDDVKVVTLKTNLDRRNCRSKQQPTKGSK